MGSPPVLYLAFLLALAPAALAQTGQIYGELVGTVVDERNAVVPGVTVTLTGPAVMGAQTAVTNDRGRYRFPAIPSGTVTLTYQLTGFQTLRREGIIVPVRQTVTIDAQIKLIPPQESVISGRSPLFDVQNSKVGERLDSETLEIAPTSRSLGGTVTLLPGMVLTRQDPAGLNAATPPAITTHGASSYNLNYFGVRIDTPPDYESMYYIDPGATEEISADTAAMGAEIGGGGGANINLVAKSGGNETRGSAYFGYTENDLAASNVDDDLRAQGITGTRLRQLADVDVDAGGPLVRDRLWWFGSVRDYATLEQVAGFAKDFESNLRNYAARMSVQMSPSNRLSGFWAFNRKLQPNTGAGMARPDPVTTLNQQSPTNLYDLNYTSVMTRNTFLEASASFYHLHWPSRYSDEFYALADNQKTPATQNITTGVFSGPEPTGERVRDTDRIQANAALTHYRDGLLGGSHQLKIGFESRPGRSTDEFRVFGDTRLRYVSAGPLVQPVEILAFNTPVTQKTAIRSFAAFVQDRVTYARVTLSAGVRWQYDAGSFPDQEGGGGRWASTTAYSRMDAPFTWNTIVPRAGLVWKTTDDGRQAVKGSYGRYAEVLYPGEFSSINPNAIHTGGVATYRWFGDRNGNGAVDAGEFDPIPLSVPQRRPYSIDSDLRAPTAEELTVAYSGEIASNLGFTAAYIQRWYRDRTVDLEVGIPVTAYAARTVTDPGPDNRLASAADNRPIILFDVLPQFRGRNATLHANFGGTERYTGLEFSIHKRLVNRWAMLASYVWSRLDGDIVRDTNNPNFNIPTHAAGRGATDQPHAVKVIGSFRMPYGLDVGVSYQALSGLPRDRELRVMLAQGPTTVRAERRGAYRSDFLSLLSVKGDKLFRLRGRARAGAFAELHNLLNSNAAEAYGTLTQAVPNPNAPYFGRVMEIVAPRILKVGGRLTF